jgi:hypothetical protein
MSRTAVTDQHFPSLPLEQTERNWIEIALPVILELLQIVIVIVGHHQFEESSCPPGSPHLLTVERNILLCLFQIRSSVELS